MNNNSKNDHFGNFQRPSPSPGHIGSGFPGASPSGSAFPIGQNHFQRGPFEASHSNMQDLSHSVLKSQAQYSNFQRQRGFLEPNRLLHAPMFSGIPQSGGNHNIPNDQSQLSNTYLNNQINAEYSTGQQVIYGTNINTSDLQRKLKEFLENFIVQREDDMNDIDDMARYNPEPYYITRLREATDIESTFLDIDCQHLYDYDQKLYAFLEDYPTDVIPIFDLVATQSQRENFLNQNVQTFNENGDAVMDGDNDRVIQVRPYNMRKTYQIRELDPVHIDKLIQLKGIIIRNSSTIPEMKTASFRCIKCQKEENAFIERGKITEPSFCTQCQTRFTFEMMHNFCGFSDKQHIKMQETPDTVPEGETPQTLHLCAYEDHVDFVKPGDRVDVVGIYRAHPVRLNAAQRTVRSIYRTYVDVIGFTLSDKKRLHNETENNNYNIEQNEFVEEEDEEVLDEVLNKEHQAGFTQDQVRKFKEFSRDPQLYDLLIDALAPSIWECHDVKKGILCQLFGGCSKKFQTSGRGRFRGEINILLCGDPSTAKSQLLQYVHKIAPRGIFTSGKGSSAVGLTVYVTRDPETREIVLESGALVLSDKGICCIDEFDKMDENTRVILHEAMEQQTVSVAKAGIICSLNARTAILAAANPVNSRYNPQMSVVDNIKLPPTLLSRFDLIYLVLDNQNEQSDRRLANHLVSLYSNQIQQSQIQSTELIRSNRISKEFFAAYISYARKNVRPKMNEDISVDLLQEYMKLRSQGNVTKTVTATPRQLESMIRIAESLAKMRLSPQVEKQDVEEAVRLIKNALQQSATDPKTGKINMDIITTGLAKSSPERIKAICDMIKSLYSQYKTRIDQHGLKYGNLYDFLLEKKDDPAFNGNKIEEREFREALRILEDDDVISVIGHSAAPTIRFNLS